jgi:hypothetical protein
MGSLAQAADAPRKIEAPDLTKIKRTIAKEPKYQGKPEYCLLVFGPEAKFHVWLVVDGAVLYVDRNGNGDLTGPGKHVSVERKGAGWVSFRPGQIGTPDGKTKFNLSRVSKGEDGCEVVIRLADGSFTHAGNTGPGELQFAGRAQDAPIVHFLGPLTLQRFEPSAGSVSAHLEPGPLVRGQVNNLALVLGTVGLGKGTFARYPCSELASATIRFATGKPMIASLAPDN